MSQAIRQFLQRGPVTSREIQAHTGLSQAAVSRHLARMGGSIVSLRSGRTVQYAVTRTAFGADDRLPFAMIDAHGDTVPAGYLRPLAHGGFFLEADTGMPRVLLGVRGNGLFDDLPYFLMDLCPQGFLGRQIAQDMNTRSPGFPANPRNWTSEHIGRYLVSNGDDLPGNLTIGLQAMDRVRHRPQSAPRAEYPQLADSVMQGVVPGSSAGGEQPKFTIYSIERQSHVIVKFSPRGDSDVARRWRDVLVTEYHASRTLHHAGIPAAETALLEADGRLFLESCRFDRVGEYGRLPMVSLQSIDAEYTGIATGWPRVVRALHDRGLVSRCHCVDVQTLWLFGTLINNTDMHLGNLSFGFEGDMFNLLPVYDMCCMGFAPRTSGEAQPLDFRPALPTDLSLAPDTVTTTMDLARELWDRVARDERISGELREFLARGNPVGRMARPA